MRWEYTSKVFSVSEAVGVVPFKNGRLTLKLLIRFVLLCTFIIAMTSYTIISGKVKKTGPARQVANVGTVLNAVQYILTGSVAVVSAVLIALNRRKLWRAYRILIFLEPNKNHDWHVYTSTFIFAALTATECCIYKSYTNLSRFMAFISYYTPIFVIILIESQFTYSMELVKDRYTTAINQLRATISQYQLHLLLIKMRVIGNAGSFISNTYSLALLFIFGGLFGVIIVQMYYIVTSTLYFLKNESKLKYASPIFVFTNIVILLAFELWKIAWISSSTKEKVTIFSKKLYGMCLTRKDQNLCKNPWIKFYLHNRDSGPITAYRFFNIELSLLKSMLGAAATYIVIIVQFQLSHQYK